MEYFDLESSPIKDRLVAKNEWAFAFPSFIPIVPGHLLICPIRIVASCEELTDAEWLGVRALQQLVSSALVRAFGADGFNFAWNQGKTAGQSVPHFHLHVVPRKKGDTGILQYEPRLFLYRPGSRAVSPEEELQEVARLVADTLPDI